MIRPTVRICVVAATIAASLSLSDHAQADERKSFFSRLNPITWFRKKDNKSSPPLEQSASGEPQSGTETTSTRTHLKDDPFGVMPGEAEASTPVVSPKIAARPQTNRDPVPVTRPSANQPVVRTPQAPDNRSGTARITDRGVEPRREPVAIAGQTPRSTKTRTGGNDFVDNFDKDYAKIVSTARRDSLPESDDEPQTPAKPSSLARTPAKPSTASRPGTKTLARTGDSNLPSLPDLPDDESAPEVSREVARTVSNSRRQAAIDELVQAARGETNMPADEEDSFAASSPKAELEHSVASRQTVQRPVVRRNEPDVEEAQTRPVPTSQTNRMSVTRSEQRSLPRTETLSSVRGTSSGLKLIAPDTVNSLIVSNELVPDRRHYTGSQSYRVNNVTTPELADELPIVSSGPSSSRSSRNQASYASSNEPVGRVTSNKSSIRSLPDNAKFQQLSFDETAAESRLPLLSIGAGSKTETGEKEPLFIFPSASKSSDQGAAESEKAVRKESAPAFDWSEKPASPAAKKAPIGTMITILTLMAIGGGVGLRLRKKGQLATAGQSPVRASHENDG